MKSGENDAWIEAIVQAIETEKAEMGACIIIMPEPLGEAQLRLMEALGVEVYVGTAE